MCLGRCQDVALHASPRLFRHNGVLIPHTYKLDIVLEIHMLLQLRAVGYLSGFVRACLGAIALADL